MDDGMLAHLWKLVTLLVLATGAPVGAQEPPQGPSTSSLQNGNQPTRDDQAKGNASAHEAAEPNGKASMHKPTIVDPSQPPHQSGSAQTSGQNGQGKNENHEVSTPSTWRFIEKVVEDPIAFFTVWVAVFTAVLAFSTIGLWRQTRRLAEQAKEEGKRSQAALETAVVATAETARAAQAAVDTLRGERAWLANSGMDTHIASQVKYQGKVQDGFVIQLYWTNYGRTIASNVRIAKDIKFIDSNGDVPVFDSTTFSSVDGSGIMGPNQPQPFQLPLVGDDLENLRNKTKRAFVYSRVSYETVFEPGVVKYTELCGELIHNGVRGGVDGRLIENFILRTRGTQNVAI